MTSGPAWPGVETSFHTVAHNGIAYLGEAVRAPGWREAYGEALRGDAYFRVVFLEAPAENTNFSLQDPRIAVCVPGRAVEAGAEQARRELRVLREAQAQYLSGPVDQTGGELEANVAELEARVAQSDAEAYAAGQLAAQPPLATNASSIFRDGDVTQWLERLGRELLMRAYPTPLMSADAPPLPLTPDEHAALLFDALMLPSSSPDASAALAAYGPFLGLAAMGGPSPLTAAPSSLLRLTGMEITGLDQIAGPDLGWRLAHHHGLTYPLATLAVLLLVRFGTPETAQAWELTLRNGHDLTLRNGQPLSEPVVTGETVLQLAWPDSLWTWAETLRQGSVDAPEGYSAIEALDPELAGISGLGAGERAIRSEQWLADYRRRFPDVVETLQGLLTAQGREWASDELRYLGRLQLLSLLNDTDSLQERMSEVFGGPPEASDTMRLWRGWRDHLKEARLLVDALGYLEETKMLEGAGELPMEKQVILERLLSPGLALAFSQWPALVESVEQFRTRYVDSYIRHHDDYHAQVGLLAHRMVEVRLQAQALERLNGISELGSPVAAELPPFVEEQYNRITACGLILTREELERSPYCPQCTLTLGSEPPHQEVQGLAGYVQDALNNQNQRLSGRLALRLVRSEPGARLQRFIDLVQVSDLSGLANVLDDEVVQFIRDLLREHPGGQGR